FPFFFFQESIVYESFKPKVQDEAIIQAFERTYINHHDVVGNFMKILDHCHGIYIRGENATHYSPYIAIIQSSGYGKSRLIAQISQKIFVVYLCFRSIESTGYPPRSSIATTVLDKMASEDDYWFENFVRITFQYAKEI